MFRDRPVGGRDEIAPPTVDRCGDPVRVHRLERVGDDEIHVLPLEFAEGRRFDCFAGFECETDQGLVAAGAIGAAAEEVGRGPEFQRV